MASPDHNHDAPLERLLGPTGLQVTCEQCFELLDEYVDLEADGLDAEARMPGMRTHLDGCPACNDEHDSLLALVAERPRQDSNLRPNG